MKKQFIYILFLSLSISGFSQNTSTIKWWNPSQNEFPVIEGQAWGSEVEKPYDRLPAKAEKTVRSNVWDLSENAAGLMIRFRSNSSQIIVRYKVTGSLQFDHMPATGVSGVDLYAITSDGDWLWCKGNRSFSDTITYRFDGLRPNDKHHKMGREYRLYLPLYNSVEYLEIGVIADSYFKPLPLRLEKPIVVYGTSIAQGACASRPGMAWTSILGRKLDRPLINLGFSGNGRLEKELIDLLVEIDAKIYILDCLPNLIQNNIYPNEELEKRILASVRQLKKERPEIPVLLVEHGAYTDGFISPTRKELYVRVNNVMKKAFSQLKSEGHKDLYLLSKEQINLQLDDMVDGTHPTDLGMMHYATAYESKLRSILKEPIGSVSTTKPRIQYREPDKYDWDNRHRKILELNKIEKPKTVILANSIIHFWGGLPRTKIVWEEASWENFFTPQGVSNYSYGWDRIENVLWRVYHGELDGFEAERIVLMIGVNNLYGNTDEEIIAGLSLLVDAIKFRQPHAKMTMAGLLPWKNNEERIAQLNLKIAQLAGTKNINYADFGQIFLNENNKIIDALFSDGLHPNAAGYRKLFTLMKPLVVE